MKKIIITILFLSFSILISDAAYMNNTNISLDNGAYITVMDTNFSSLKKYGADETPNYTLEYTINGSRIRYTTLTNKTISSPAFNVSLDNFTVNVSGQIGYLNFSVMMNNASDAYNLTSNAAFVDAKNTSSDRIIFFNYTGLYPAFLAISWNASFPLSQFILEGFVNNTLEFYLNGARVDVNGTHVFTNTSGYYIINNITEGNYTVLIRQIGYRNNSQNVSIIGNNSMHNVTLLEKQSAAVKVSPGFELPLLLLLIFLLSVFRRKS